MEMYEFRWIIIYYFYYFVVFLLGWPEPYGEEKLNTITAQEISNLLLHSKLQYHHIKKFYIFFFVLFTAISLVSFSVKFSPWHNFISFYLEHFGAHTAFLLLSFFLCLRNVSSPNFFFVKIIVLRKFYVPRLSVDLEWG